MKKIALICSIIMLVALAGCNENEASKTTEENAVELTTTESKEPETTEITTEATTESQSLPLELQATDNQRIMTLLDVSGSYTDSVGNPGDYHYQLPQFNADSESAKTLNKRIEAEISKPIEDEFFNMEGGYSLMCYTITYEVFEYGDIVAIVVTVPYPNDYRLYYAYTYDFAQDKELTNADLLAMNNMTEEEFVEKACQMGEDYFMNQASGMGMTEQEDIDLYMEDAKKATTADLPMFYDENGVLNAYVPFPSIAGAVYYYHLCQF